MCMKEIQPSFDLLLPANFFDVLKSNFCNKTPFFAVQYILCEISALIYYFRQEMNHGRIIFCRSRSAPSSSAGSLQPTGASAGFLSFFCGMGVAELENLWLAGFDHHDHRIHINPVDLSWLQISTPAPDDWWILTWLCWLHVNLHCWLQVRHLSVSAKGCWCFVQHNISEKKLRVLSLF